ncbi:hypothetical protein K7I13_14780 [Brucepastera parasyntrophica]|uniref:hypothetical protein n=1 Tax=Brucepastera parasyntrophica TaxID=2880008 RepID=UPI00210DD3B4|nr:hypothetical protein [Brucepastera parasyntrophica]ULQ59699.1 hypothetical protein K7I13_14780 [Brucepastera parasyntrophica]
MKSYYIRNNTNTVSFLSVVRETEEGYMVRITRDLDGYTKVIDEFLPKMLFDSCLRTGYLSEIEESAENAIA